MPRRVAAGEVSATLPCEGGGTIAYRHRAGALPGILFLGGFRSDMSGTKASALDDFAIANGRAYTRFDYRGHGQSSGRFEDCTIGDWRADALAVIDATTGPHLLVGSSMGAWIAILVALARPERVAGLIGIAAAPDFTEDLIWQRLDESERRILEETGRLLRPSAYSQEPDLLTRALLEEGRRHLVLRGPIPIDCPVRLLHGAADADVPWHTSLRLLERLSSGDVRLTLIKDGDHRLSQPEQIEAMLGAVAELSGP